MKLWIYPLAVALIFCCMIFTVPLLPEEVIRVFLASYALVVRLYYHISMEYIPGVGFVPAGLPFIIGKDCMGTNITAMLFLLMAFPLLKVFNYRKTFCLLCCFLAALIIGFLANSARIILSIPFCAHEKFNMIHGTIGIATHLFVLIGCYAVLTLYIRPVP